MAAGHRCAGDSLARGRAGSSPEGRRLEVRQGRRSGQGPVGGKGDGLMTGCR